MVTIGIEKHGFAPCLSVVLGYLVYNVDVASVCVLRSCLNECKQFVRSSQKGGNPETYISFPVDLVIVPPKDNFFRAGAFTASAPGLSVAALIVVLCRIGKRILLLT